MKSLVILVFIGVCSCTTFNTKLSQMTKLFDSKLDKLREEKTILTHTLQKRQDDKTETICLKAQQRGFCESPAILEARINLELECGFNDEAMRIADGCATNAVGEICDNFFQDDVLIKAARQECLNGTSVQPCSTGCTNALQTLRNNIGCCINSNTYFNSSFSSTANLFDSTLWNECGVETVGQCERPITVTPANTTNRCNEAESLIRRFEIQCSNRIQPVLAALREANVCEVYIQQFTSLCSIKSDGEYCFNASHRVAMETGYALGPVREHCSENQTSCSSACKNALEEFGDNFGCCINLKHGLGYNNTNDPESIVGRRSEVFATTYALWSQCGVQTPPLMCESVFKEVAENPNVSTPTNVYNSGVVMETKVYLLCLTTVLAVTLGKIFY